MRKGKNLADFKAKLLVFPCLLIAAVSLPMALGLVSPNGIYGFRTAGSLASADAWYRSNFWAGIVGLGLGLSGALLNLAIMKARVLTEITKAVLAAGVAVLVALAAMVAGFLAI